MLAMKLRGHDAYYGITGNGRALEWPRYWVQRDWFNWLRRRSGGARRNWDWMQRLLEVFPLPAARVVHSVLPRVVNP
jgi:RNA-directed DNA polymerase